MTLVVSCGLIVDEALLGCAVQLHILPGFTAPYQSPLVTVVNSTSVSITLMYYNMDVAHVVLGAVDAAGNVASNVTLQWRMDTTVSVSLPLSLVLSVCVCRLFCAHL